ncbi:hypothetical protein AB0H37_42845 [Actinomadura sp. NPDC023710]|uniref:hypothetical protein n=1 Tax=Actinomadura sp. NPDC023710 TaxID=3158219 RepID=UPI0034064EC0
MYHFDPTTGILTEVGQIWYIQADLMLINPNTATYQYQQSIGPFKLERSAATGMTVSGGFSCVGWCEYGPVTYPKQNLTTNTVAEGERYFGTTVKNSGEIGDITVRADYSMGKSGFTNTPTEKTYGPQVRCDNALPGVSTVGCVFPQYIPAMDYSLTGPYPQLASHIKRAQESGLPGAPGGTPLNRITDATLRQKNGDRACPAASSGGYPRPDGHDCDEYPFRSTVQGAYTAGSYTPDDPATPPARPWPARTFDGCQITEPRQTGDVGYSVCMIDSGQNQNGGSDLNSVLYVPERVLDRDRFYVWITP